MILGSLKARSQRAFNAPNPIDFLWLKPEKIAREVTHKPNVRISTRFEQSTTKKLYSFLFPVLSGGQGSVPSWEEALSSGGATK